MSNIPVYEIFGPTIQGEGMYCGYRTMFLRVAGCDYHCLWCDTKYARNINQARQVLSEEEIFRQIREGAKGITKRVTITGGNPCIHDLSRLISLLKTEDYLIHIETQGSVIPTWLDEVSHVCLSPKPPSSGNPTDYESFSEFIHSGVSKELKVVVGTEEDYLYAKKVHQFYQDCPLTLQACTIGDPLPGLNWLINKVCSDPEFSDFVRVLPQLHALIGIK